MSDSEYKRTYEVGYMHKNKWEIISEGLTKQQADDRYQDALFQVALYPGELMIIRAT